MAETGIPSSFIPHDTALPPPARRRGTGGLNDLLLLSGIVLFVASAALAVGVFLYVQLLSVESASKVQQLKVAEAAFDPSLIEKLTKLDDRMHAAQAIVSAHAAPTVFFDALGQATPQTVSFQSLDFEAPDSQHVAIKMSGVAQSVNSIAFASDLFGKNAVIQSPIFSNIARQQDGVHFDLAAVVNPASISYDSLVAAQSSASAGAPSSGSAPASQTNQRPSPFGGPGALQPQAPASGGPPPAPQQ